MGFRVSVFGLRFSVLWFPVLWLHRICLLKSSQGQSLHQDLGLDSSENRISSFHLWFAISCSLISRPLAWLCLSLEVLSWSEPPSWSLFRFNQERDFEVPSLVYDFASSGFIVSALEVLPGSEPPSWSLFRFNRERDFEFKSLVYDFPSSGLIVSVSWSPLRVRASITIFA